MVLLIFITILILNILVRVIQIDILPPPFHIDEIFIAESAIRILEKGIHAPLLETFASAPIISALPTALFIKLFGVNALPLRLQSIILGILINLFLFLWVKDSVNRRIALLAFFIGSISHLAIAYSRLNLPNIQSAFLLVLSLYLANRAFTAKKYAYFLLLGLTTGLSLYSYSGAKMNILIILFYLLLYLKKVRFRNFAIFLLGLFIMFFPILLYLFNPTQNYLTRETEVMIINKPQYWHDAWQANNPAGVMVKQFEVNFRSFIDHSDYSNQYGNGVLVDTVSSILLLIFFAFCLPYCVLLISRREKEKVKFLLFTVISFFIYLVLISLTESPPLSQRLLIVYPFVSIFISLSMDRIVSVLPLRSISTVVLAAVLFGIFVLNVRQYFYTYLHEERAEYSWINPNSAIGFYMKKRKNCSFYLLKNDETFSHQQTISIINYKSPKSTDISNLSDFNRFMQSSKRSQVILPLVPKEVAQRNAYLANSIQRATSSNNYIQRDYWGVWCRGCQAEPLFKVISKKGLECEE